MAMLDVTKLSISFGGLRAVDELTMQIEEGGLVGLIGPNGAGKTTVFNMLTGVYLPTEGGIRLDGKNLIGKKPADICKMGVARTFQNIRLFPKLSVLDNVKAGLHNQVTYSLAESMLHLGGYSKKKRIWIKGHWKSSVYSGLTAPPTIWRPTCPTANSVNWKSPVRLPPAPSFSCWMSLPPV